MTEQTSETLRAWFKRVEPIYPELFNLAHVVCGNYDRAEYALRSAILDVWEQNADGGMGFREKLRAAARDEALREAESDTEFTWPGFPETSPDPLIRQAARERIETQRILMLRHGVGLSVGKIARLTDTGKAQVREALDRFEARARRGLTGQERARFDALFSRAAKRELNSRSDIPHAAAVYRGFEAEASQAQVPDRRLGKFAFMVLALAMALVCAFLFWLFAVLVQPPAMENAQTPPAAEEPVLAMEEAPTDAPSPTDVPVPEAAPPAVSEANFVIDPPASIETTYETEAPG